MKIAALRKADQRVTLLCAVPGQRGANHRVVVAVGGRTVPKAAARQALNRICRHFVHQRRVRLQHGLLRAYARALLADAGEMDVTFDHYADHVTEQSAQFDTLPPEQWGQLDPLLPYVDFVGDELAARWESAAVTGPAPLEGLTQCCGDFAHNVTPYVFRRPQAIPTPEGTRLRGMNWLECGLAASREQRDPRREASFLNELAVAWSALGEPRKALGYHEQALPRYRLTDFTRKE